MSKEVTTTEIVDTSLFNPILSNIDYEHLKVCPCHSYKVDSIFKKNWAKMLVKLNKSNGTMADYVLKSHKIDCYVDTLKTYAANLPDNSKCPLEIQSITNTLLMFEQSRYDLNDPVVFNIVKNTLNIELNNFRLQLLSRDSSLIRSTTNDKGDVKWELNPAVEASRKASDTVIKAMQILSNIVDGTKNVNVNVNLDVIKSVWEKRRAKKK